MSDLIYRLFKLNLIKSFPGRNDTNSPEELKVQTRLGKEEFVVLLKPDFTHGGVLEETPVSVSTRYLW